MRMCGLDEVFSREHRNGSQFNLNLTFNYDVRTRNELFTLLDENYCSTKFSLDF